jgi:ABC-type multidrug transport system fused ATPase/permease subunit
MLGLVRAHRLAMTWGIILGFGVALTYATSLIGVLPVLKVVVERQDLNRYLHERAEHAHEAGRWWAPQLAWLADRFPSHPPMAGAPSGPTAEQNAALNRAQMQTLLILLGGLLVVNILGNGLRCASQYLVLYATHRTMMDLRRRMYRKSLRVSMTQLAGDLSNTVSQFMSDTREIFIGITTLFGKVAREPLKAVCVLAVALFVDWKLTLMTLAIAPPAILLLWYFGRKVRKAAVKLLQGYGRMLGGLEETLQGISVVKSYAQEGRERKRMWTLERRMLRQQLKLAWVEALSSPLIEVVGVLAAAAGTVWLASRTFHGEITTSQFGTMVLLLAAMLDPVRKVANVYNLVQRSGAAAERVFQFLDLPEERSGRRRLASRAAANAGPGMQNAESSTAVAAQDSLGRSAFSVRRSAVQDSALRTQGSAPGRLVEFEGVTFRYAPDLPPAVADVSLRIEPGECVAIVGPNGSGKSTLMRLLPRLLEPQDGTIRIDGFETRELSLKALREQIAIVDQRPVIFARSARENIAYGHAAATLEEIRDAARRAYAAEFIERWADQYETEMGEFGTTISGGQRQRLSIARAFLKPASILIFDEATSEIDAESERKIHAALRELRQGKTTFLIAHRHTVMEMAERIVVMDAGRIIDAGTHAELIERCPLYVALYRSPVAH